MGLPPHTPPLILGVQVPVGTLLLIMSVSSKVHNHMKYNLLTLTPEKRQQFNEATPAVQAALAEAWGLKEINGSGGGYGPGAERLRKERTTYSGTQYFKTLTVPATPSVFKEWEAVIGEDDKMYFIKSTSLSFFLNGVIDDQEAGIEFPVTCSVNSDGDTVLVANSGLGFNTYTSDLDDVSYNCIGTSQYPRKLKQYSKEKKAELTTV